MIKSNKPVSNKDYITHGIQYGYLPYLQDVEMVKSMPLDGRMYL
jgi:hypothetical protein